MKKNKVLIISLVIVVVVALVLVLAITMYKDKKNTKNNMEIINKNYELLKKQVAEYNDIRTKYSELSSVLIMTEYEAKHEEFSDLLNEYNDVIKNIDTYIANIKLRCNTIYPDSEINNICNGYEAMYDKMIDLYVDDVSKYNAFIDEYNEYKNTVLDKIEMIHGNLEEPKKEEVQDAEEGSNLNEVE